MFHATPSPIFDVPEFPTLRRIKPLPKRRRTLGPTNENIEPFSPMEATTLTSPSIPPAILQTLSQQQWHQPTPLPLDTLNPNLAADELLSHTDRLATHMALQNYYLPILGNVQHFLADHGRGNDSGNATAAAAAALAAVTGDGKNISSSLADLESIEFGVHFAAAAAVAVAAGVPMSGLGNLGLANMNAPMGTGNFASTVTERAGLSLQASNTIFNLTSEAGTPLGRQEGIIRGQENYVDQASQPGNTKKRKVPTNVGGSPRATGNECNVVRPTSPSLSYLEEEGVNGPSDVGGNTAVEALQKNGGDYDLTSLFPSSYPPPPFPGQMAMLMQRKGKMTAVTLAGLQHKEMLKIRKRQLASVMESLSYSDTLALDQALSATYPFASGAVGKKGEQLKIRKSKRKGVRLMRVVKAIFETPKRKKGHPDTAPFPSSDFMFKCSSASEYSFLTLRPHRQK